MRAVVTSCKGGASSDHSMTAYALTLPDANTLAQDMTTIDPDAIHAAQSFVKKNIAKEMQADFTALYESLSTSSDYMANKLWLFL